MYQQKGEKYSSEYKRDVRYEFESFCKKVIRSERCDYLRWYLRHAEVEKNFSDLPDYVVNNFSSRDGSLAEEYMFEICGYAIPIRDDRLAEELLEMKEEERSVLLLAYAVGISDREISGLLHTSRSRVQWLRSKLLQAIQKRLKG